MSMRVCRWLLPGLLALLAAPPGVVVAAEAGDPGAALLERADEFLTVARSFVAEQHVTFFKERRKEREMRVRVLARHLPETGSHEVLSIVLEPETDRGKALLRESGDVWFSGPGSRRASRVSGRYSVAGRLTIDDLLRTAYPREYLVEDTGRETVRVSAESELEADRLDLVAMPGTTAYPTVTLFLEPGDGRPLMARVYGRQGRLLKTILFRDYGPVLGGVHPRRIVVVQSGGRGHVHEIRLEDIREADPEPGLFRAGTLPETARRLLTETP